MMYALTRITKQLILLTILFIMSLPTIMASAKTKWNADLKSGDIVCIWDIHANDPLVHDRTSSFKHWYKNPNEQSRYELKPTVRNLRLKVIHPGLEIVTFTKNNINETWYSGWLLVEKGGEDIDLSKITSFMRGETILYQGQGKYPIPNYHLIHFEAARFKKSRAVLGCKRKY